MQFVFSQFDEVMSMAKLRVVLFIVIVIIAIYVACRSGTTAIAPQHIMNRVTRCVLCYITCTAAIHPLSLQDAAQPRSAYCKSRLASCLS